MFDLRGETINDGIEQHKNKNKSKNKKKKLNETKVETIVVKARLMRNENAFNPY